MSDKKTVIGDEMIETQLKKYSSKLNISVDELIERYIRRELYYDDYYEPPKYTLEELIERGKKDVEWDRKHGIFRTEKFDLSFLIGIINNDD